MRRSALALLLGYLLLVAGVSAIDGYDYYQTIEYAGCDQEIYQQDIVIHRTTGTAYEEVVGPLRIWHIYVGDHCLEDYGDIRFTNSTGAELAYYLWPDYDSSSARVCVRMEGADQSGTLTVWYGNQSAEGESDGDAVGYCDAFSEISEAWDTSGVATATIDDGRLKTTGIADTWESSHKTASVKRPVSIPYAFSAEVDLDYVATPNCLGKLFLVVETSSSFTAAGYQDNNYDAAGGFSYILNGGSVVFSGKNTRPASGKMHLQITRDASNTIKIYENGNIRATGTMGGDITAIGLTNIRFQTYAGNIAYWDNLIVRAYSATPPAALTFSGERETASPPAAAFTATPTAGLAPLTVQFTDLSGGRPTSWHWDFGDGTSSTTQNPQHTYTTPGTYTVTLTATNEYGSDTETKTDYITVYGPVTAQFTANVTGGTAPLAVQFTDLSTGGPTSWLWDFGDGNTSTAQNPQHTYTTAGLYTVTLTASHPYDSDTETKTAYITVAVLQPFPGLTLIPRDLTGNGLYTDINGNNRLDYNDLTVFFQNLAWAKTNQPTECFDFNGNNRLDYNDVITLFSIIMEEHT